MNEVVKIKTIEYIHHESDRYDIEVEDNKNYFADNILVHNTKLTLWRNAEDFVPNDYTQNWIVSYKNQILFPEEFTTVDREDTKRDSAGISQYAFIHDHLRSIQHNLGKIPTETEFFVEFIQNKPTLTRDYSTFHGLVLIAWAPATAKVTPTYLKTNPSGFHQEDLKDYADMLSMGYPKPIFKGTLATPQDFSRGIVSPALKKLFTAHRGELYSDDLMEYFEAVKRVFLELPSPFGGPEEGVVLQTEYGQYYKIQQSDQLDKEKRYEKKKRYISDDPELEKKYWDQCKLIADKIVAKLPKEDIKHSVKTLSEFVYSLSEKQLPRHDKKTPHERKDDIYLIGKQFVIGRHPLNDNAMFIGKMRVLTTAHAGAIQQGLDNFTNVTVALVSGKDQVVPKELREQMIKAVFPNVEVVHVSTGNLYTAMGKSDQTIQHVLAGSDRVDAYRQMLSRSHVDVIEIKRDMDSADNVSATRTFKAIAADDFETFKQLTPPPVHRFFEQLKQYV